MENSKIKKLTYSMLATTMMFGGISIPTTTYGEKTSSENIQITSKQLESKIVYSSTFNLSDWTFSETNSEIVLSKYNGSETSLYIPGEYNGKQVVLTNLSIIPSSMTHLKIEEVNSKKLKLQTTSLENAFFFRSGIVALDLNGLDVSKVTTIDNMFFYMTNLKELKVNDWDTSNITSMNYVFSALPNLIALDVSEWDTSNVITMEGLFSNLTSIKILDIERWDTSNVENMTTIFANNTNLETLNLNDWDTSKVKSFSGAFMNTTNLKTLDIANWDVSNVVEMDRMFYNCGLQTLDVGSWDTSSTATMMLMFANMLNLTNINLDKWNTKNVINMSSLFENTPNLKFLDIKDWDVSNVFTMDFMFYKTGLKELDLSAWNTGNTVHMNFMFDDSFLETLDLSNWNLTNTLHMEGIFSTNSLKVIDLTGWDISNIYSRENMFFTDEETPLLIITTDDELKRYDCLSDNRVGATITLNANGGLFGNGNTEIKSSNIQFLDDRKIETINRILIELIETNGAVSNPKHTFTGWSSTESQSTIDEVPLDQLYNLFNHTNYAQWTYNNVNPVIEAEDKIVHIGDTFNPLEGVIVTDYEDGEIVLTESNISSNTVDIHTSGTYEVTYEVTDNHGATVTKTIQVVVNTKPIIKSKEIILTVGDVFNLSDFVTIFDEEDGEIKVTEDHVISTNLVLSEVGIYQIEVQVADSHGAVVSKEIPVIVKELEKEDDNSNSSNDSDVDLEDNETSTDNGVVDENDKNENQSSDKKPTNKDESVGDDEKEDIETGISAGFLVLIGGLSLLSGFRLLKNKKAK